MATPSAWTRVIWPARSTVCNQRLLAGEQNFSVTKTPQPTHIAYIDHATTLLHKRPVLAPLIEDAPSSARARTERIDHLLKRGPSDDMLQRVVDVLSGGDQEASSAGTAAGKEGDEYGGAMEEWLAAHSPKSAKPIKNIRGDMIRQVPSRRLNSWFECMCASLMWECGTPARHSGSCR